MGRSGRKLSKLEMASCVAEGHAKSDLVFDLKTLNGRIRLAAELLQSSAFDHPRRLTDIAAALNISSSHLRHLFKKEVGVSPAQYVKLLRLQRAKGLLTTTFLSVKEVMFQVGLADLSHFVRNYKIAFGETPSQTRASAARKLRSA
jgi:transcriptional regulator GlxA family with amidase domain